LTNLTHPRYDFVIESRQFAAANHPVGGVVMAFTKVATVQEIPPGRGKEVTVGGKTLAVFNDTGKFYALDNECTHSGAPLAEGDCEGGAVQCPWHGACFNLATGEVLAPPARRGVKAYTVQVVGDEVQVDV